MKLTKIPVNKILPSQYQTRIVIDNVKTLAADIETHGLQQPITVRELPNGELELVFGARRLEAAKLIGWETIPGFIRKLSDAESAEICLSENLHRDNLNAIEEAKLFEMMINKFGYTH